MVNYNELYQRLRRQIGGLGVSVILPAEPGFQDHKKTHPVLRNAFRDVKEEMERKGYDKEIIEDYVNRLESLVEDFSLAESQEGLGLYVGYDIAELVHFSFPVEPYILVDETFEVRHLVYGMNQVKALYVLVLSQKRSKVLLVEGEKVENVTNDPDGAEDLLDNPADDWMFEGQRNDQELYHQYLQHIDKLLGEHLNERKLPVVLAGDNAAVSYFRKHSKHQEFIGGELAGSFEKVSTRQLRKALEPIREQISRERAERIVDEYRIAIGHELGISGLQTIWQNAQEGRVLHLIVEKDYQQSAYLDADGYKINSDPMNTDGMRLLEDAVDDLIEAVLERQGNVFFVENNELEADGKIAAILRY